MSVLGAVSLVLAGVGLLAMLLSAGQNAGAGLATMMAVWAVFVLAVSQLIYHLACSLEAIKHPPLGQEARGFEPLPISPAVAVVMGPGIVAEASPQPRVDPADGTDTTYDPPARR
jgi:hypothetical protein